VAIALGVSVPALAADERGRPSDRALAPLVACRPIADPRARAVCYDNALDKLQQSVAERTVVVVDRDTVKTTGFGFSGGQPPRRAPVRPQEEEEVVTTIVSATSAGYETWTIRLANGAVWRTTDDLGFQPRSGAEARIKRGALGSYMMRIGKAPAVRVKRID
jgi:hypothetical protein